jgi:spectinomycin phosphotransferase
MREPPALAEAALLGALRGGYGLAARALEFLPLGLDAAAAGYHVWGTDGRDYFLKARRHGVNPASLAVPRYLHEQGAVQVPAPLRTPGGALTHPLDGWTLVLYPFLRDALPLPSGHPQWRRFGATLRQVHDTALPAELARLLPRETFEPAATARVRALDDHLGAHVPSDSLARALAATWHTHAHAIHAVVEQAERLGPRLRQAAPASALRLCHADPHWDNVLLDAHDQLWLVDWDETCLSLKERDLMFVIGGISGDWPTPGDTALFLEGYGPAAIGADALAYYRADWAVQDIGAFAQEVLWDQSAGEETRRDAVRFFAGLFGPGAIVEKALNG